MSGLEKLPPEPEDVWRDGKRREIAHSTRWGGDRDAGVLQPQGLLKVLFGIPPLEQRLGSWAPVYKAFTAVHPEDPLRYILDKIITPVFVTTLIVAGILLARFYFSGQDFVQPKTTIFYIYSDYFYYVSAAYFVYAYVRIKVNLDIAKFPVTFTVGESSYELWYKLGAYHVFLMYLTALGGFGAWFHPDLVPLHLIHLLGGRDSYDMIIAMTMLAAFLQSAATTVILYVFVRVEKHIRWNRKFWCDIRGEE